MPFPPEIQLGPHRLKVVTLSTGKEQSAGFMRYKTIPREYGLLFPERGSSHFHMQSVGEPLLIVALDKQGKVVGKEIRQPESPGKPVAGGKGHDIFELHPIYDRYVHVGSDLDATGRVQSDYLDSVLDQQNVRVVVQNDKVIAHYNQATTKQKAWLRNFAIEEQKELQDDNGKVIEDGRREAQTRPYGWWMEPTGKLIKTWNHEQTARDILDLPRKLSLKSCDGNNSTKLLEKGYLRLVQLDDGSSVYFVEGTPSMAQRKALKQTAEDLGIVFYDGQNTRKILYDGRDLQREATLSIPPKVLIQETR